MQLINSKVSGPGLVACEECGRLRPGLTHQAGLSSIFFSTSSLLFSAPLPYIRPLIFIHSYLTFQSESSPSDCWKGGREGSNESHIEVSEVCRVPGCVLPSLRDITTRQMQNIGQIKAARFKSKLDVLLEI